MLKSLDHSIHEYTFDEEEQLWCEITFKVKGNIFVVEVAFLTN